MVNNILKIGIENVLGLSNIPKFGLPYLRWGEGSGTFSKWYESSSMMMETNLKR